MSTEDEWADSPCIREHAARPVRGRGVVRVPPGIQVPYWVEGDPGGRRLICAHGGAGIAVDVRIAMAPLVDAGWTLVSFDHRGHGRASPVRDPDLFDPMLMGAEFLAVMDDLGWDRCWIGGASMGAATSLAAAIQAPERVEGLALMAPTVGDWALDEGTVTLLNDIERGAALGPEGFLARTRTNTEAGRASPDPTVRARASYLLERAALQDSASIACFVRSAPSWRIPGALEALASFEFPVVVMAQPDAAHPLATAEAYARAVAHGTYRCVEPDNPHLLTGRGTALLDTFAELGITSSPTS